MPQTSTHATVSVIIPAYRNASGALALVDALRGQHLAPETRMEIMVVDDGSDDGSAARLLAAATGSFTCIALARNAGRSAARNAGAAAATGKFLVFIDSDCRPIGVDFLQRHATTLAAGAVASLGRVDGSASGFWGHYQRVNAQRRAGQTDAHASLAGSAANLGVRRAAFERSGGFDPRYQQYGFEDRDLLLRLRALGPVECCAGAVVQHVDVLTLPLVLAKLQTAGGASAVRFARDHPAAYRELGYARIDTRLQRGLRWPVRVLAPMLRVAPTLDRVLAEDWLPFALRRGLVKALSALAFAVGTTRHD